MTTKRVVTFFLVLVMAAVLNAAPMASAADKPARDFIAALRYPGLTIGVDEDVRVDLVVKNTGRQDETIMLEVVSQPEGWETMIRSYGDQVTGIFVAANDDRAMNFVAKSAVRGAKLTPGKYHFAIKAWTQDKAISKTTSIDVTVVEAEKRDDVIKLTTSFPVLRGPSDSKFEFSLDVKNDADDDSLFNLLGAGPEGWEISFKPPYEEKQISSLQIEGRQNSAVNVQVTPPPKAEAGEYPIKVKVKSAKGDDEAEAVLMVVLTGTYKLKAGTTDGLLSLTTQRGKAGTVSLYIQNEGSATQREISFLSFKPENWNVEFKPEKIEGLKPGELKQVEIAITPGDQALVGDYSVAVSAQGEKESKEVEFRVTVKASSAWGWIGVAIIMLVIIALGFIFRKLGRR